MFKFIIRNSKEKIMTSLRDIAKEVHDAELQREFYELAQILKNQEVNSKSWKKIDSEMGLMLKELAVYVSKGYMKVARNYKDRFDTFVTNRGLRDKFKPHEIERDMFKAKNEKLEKEDIEDIEKAQKIAKAEQDLAKWGPQLPEKIKEIESLTLQKQAVLNKAEELVSAGTLDSEKQADLKHTLSKINRKYNLAKTLKESIQKTIDDIDTFIDLSKYAGLIGELKLAQTATDRYENIGKQIEEDKYDIDTTQEANTQIFKQFTGDIHGQASDEIDDIISNLSETNNDADIETNSTQNTQTQNVRKK